MRGEEQDRWTVYPLGLELVLLYLLYFIIVIIIIEISFQSSVQPDQVFVEIIDIAMTCCTHFLLVATND